MMPFRSYKVELDPNNKQITMFKQHCGVARFVWNWALALLIEDYKSGRRELRPKSMDLTKLLNSIKKEQFPWMYNSCSQVPTFVLRQVENAYNRFFKKLSKSPKFKKKNKSNSFSLQYPVISDTYIKLPKIGKVRLKESNYIPSGNPKQVTISCTAGRWFASVFYEYNPKQVVINNDILGVDLGISKLAGCSDGAVITPPNKEKKYEKKLKRTYRKLSRQKLGSNSRAKTKIILSRIYYRIANERKDILHKTTSVLVKTKPHGTIVIEDLAVKNMMKNHCLAKAIANVGFYEFRRQLEYKCKWYGKTLIIANRFYPSSKTCSQCGCINKDLKLSDRTFLCPSCGLDIDRDLNASINLARYTAGSAEINASGDEKFINSDQSELRCSSMKLELIDSM
jgi:putative transposase